jgi:hypothetical protein
MAAAASHGPASLVTSHQCRNVELIDRCANGSELLLPCASIRPDSVAASELQGEPRAEKRELTIRVTSVLEPTRPEWGLPSPFVCPPGPNRTKGTKAVERVRAGRGDVRP